MAEINTDRPTITISEDINIETDLEDGWFMINDHLHYSAVVIGLAELDSLIIALQTIRGERLNQLLITNEKYRQALEQIVSNANNVPLNDSKAQFIAKANDRVAKEALDGTYRVEEASEPVTHEIDTSEWPLDEGIADLVYLLRANEFNTFTSCEGGEGHAFASPTIRIDPRYPNNMQAEAARLARVLSAAGYGGYYVKICRSYQHEATPWGQPLTDFIELEFWAEAVDGD